MCKMINKSTLLLFALSLLALCQTGWSQSPAPAISQILPGYERVNFSVQIFGSGFGTQQNGSTITFNGVPATLIEPWSDTTLTVDVPPGATTGPVVVTVGGVPSNSVNFIVTNPLTLFLSSLDSSTSGLKQLSKTTASSASYASPDLANQPVGDYLIQAFDTQAGVPGSSTTWLAGVGVSFFIWMHQSAGATGTLFPEVRLYLNSPSGTPVCSAVGTSALTTSTLVYYTLACAPSVDVALTPTDRYYLWVGVNSTTVTTSSLQAQLNVGFQVRGRPYPEIIVPFQ